jgi:hypothetical protein
MHPWLLRLSGSFVVAKRMSRPPKKTGDYVGPLLDYLPTPQPRTSFLASDEAIERILAEVPSKFVPANLDRSALRTAIQEAAAGRDAFERIHSGRRARANAKILKDIREGAQTLAALLEEDDEIKHVIQTAFRSVFRDLTLLSGVAAILEQRSGKPSQDARSVDDRIASANEWLAGVGLPLAFEECFHRKAGRARSGGKPGGPTVSFVAAVMLEMGIPLKAETIVRAMTRHSKILERRRAGRRRDLDTGQK